MGRFRFGAFLFCGLIVLVLSACQSAGDGAAPGHDYLEDLQNDLGGFSSGNPEIPGEDNIKRYCDEDTTDCACDLKMSICLDDIADQTSLALSDSIFNFSDWNDYDANNVIFEGNAGWAWNSTVRVLAAQDRARLDVKGSLDVFTLSARFEFKSSDWRPELSKPISIISQDQTQNVFLGIGIGNIPFIKINGARYEHDRSIEKDGTHYLQLVKTPNALSIYVNGRRLKRLAHSTPIAIRDITFGGGGKTALHMRGTFDDIRVYQKALRLWEIRQIVSDLRHYWRFEGADQPSLWNRLRGAEDLVVDGGLYQDADWSSGFETKQTTMAVWLRLPSDWQSDERQAILSHPVAEKPNDRYHPLGINPDRSLYFDWGYHRSRILYFESDAQLERGVWHHVVVTRTHHQAKIYLDGSLVASSRGIQDNYHRSFRFTDSSLVIGSGWKDGSKYAFEGEIAEVHVFAREFDKEGVRIHRNKTELSVTRHPEPFYFFDSGIK